MRGLSLNLGCGPVFVDSPNWLNLDFSPATPAVYKANLLERLPVGNESASVIYSSHFLEHVPRDMVPGLLNECLRVLQHDGMLRLVLPDLENLASEYLTMRKAGEHDKADFVVLELVDQCIRRERSGDLGRYPGSNEVVQTSRSCGTISRKQLVPAWTSPFGPCMFV